MAVKTTRAAAAANEPGPAAGHSDSHDPLHQLRREVDRLFQDFYRRMEPPFAWRTSGFNPFGRLEMEFGSAGEVMPRADLVETANAFELTLELPGVTDDAVEVSLAEDMLEVSGVKGRRDSEGEAEHHLSERRFGQFRRSFRLPKTVDADRLSAELERGVLVITMPKRPEMTKTAKRVEISSA